MKQKDFFELAEELEKNCGDWEHAEGMSVEKKAALIAKVEQMDREAAEKPKNFRLKKRYVLVLAAALVLLMGTSVVGDRAWIARDKDISRESEVTTKVNNEEKDSVLLEEEVIYQEIAEKLGIATMRLGYIPNGMELDSYVVMESTGYATLNYLYDDSVVSVQMMKQSEELSGNVQWDGAARRLEEVSNDFGQEFNAYCVDEEYKNYAANLTYGNGYYSIMGSFSNEEEFREILSMIYFKNL